mmetsp:Transcript_113222/g.307442  ORF Transcript_113222/g.307442 Transcript_113222/m.307442 type:complete len:213 (+) Transcript_113222:98-736(+)
MGTAARRGPPPRGPSCRQRPVRHMLALARRGRVLRGTPGTAHGARRWVCVEALVAPWQGTSSLATARRFAVSTHCDAARMISGYVCARRSAPPARAASELPRGGRSNLCREASARLLAAVCWLCSFRRGGATYQYRRYGILDATAPRGLGCAAGDQLYSPALVDVSAPPPPSCTGGRQASGGRMELLPGEGFAIVVIASLTAVAGAVVPAPG